MKTKITYDEVQKNLETLWEEVNYLEYTLNEVPRGVLDELTKYELMIEYMEFFETTEAEIDEQGKVIH